MDLEGLVLAGGHGTRLAPLTRVVNKHLLAIYDKPLIYYPIIALRDAGVSPITVTLGVHEPGRFFELLGNGEDLGVDLRWHYHGDARGIAYAVNSWKPRWGGKPFVVHLGDNIFLHGINKAVEFFLSEPDTPAVVLKRVPKSEASRYGVAEVEGSMVKRVVEKPRKPKSDYAMLGLYYLTGDFFDAFKQLKPSKRGEYEISDAVSILAETVGVRWFEYRGRWYDCGTFDDMLDVSNVMRFLKIPTQTTEPSLTSSGPIAG